MAYHTNLRRVFDRWDRAAMIARNYGYQTGWKHRVRKAGKVWRVERTDRRVTYRTRVYRLQYGEMPVTVHIPEAT